MSKDRHILSIGFEIPGKSSNCLNFGTTKSFMDADIIIISPEKISPSGDWVSFSSGGGCYDLGAAERYIQSIKRLKKEIKDSLSIGKTVFILLAEKNTFSLASGVTSPRKGERNYSTTTVTNYTFLPTEIGDITSAHGDQILFTGNPIFSEFNNKYKGQLEYNAYLENIGSANIIYTGKDKTKVLSAIYREGNGHIVVLPKIDYDYGLFVEEDNETGKEVWTKKAIQFGKELAAVFISIDRKLSTKSEKTPPPEWTLDSKYYTKESTKIESEIESSKLKIENIKSKIQQLSSRLNDENQLKDLLYEQGKPLEDAVTIALKILGYQAENYDDGNLELDHVIISPENVRFIGECEGKDSKDINITKFRQL